MSWSCQFGNVQHFDFGIAHNIKQRNDVSVESFIVVIGFILVRIYGTFFNTTHTAVDVISNYGTF